MKQKGIGLIIIILGLFSSGCLSTYTAPTIIPPIDFTIRANGTTESVTTTELTLTFNEIPTDFDNYEIKVTGATKGLLTGTGTSRILKISDISVFDGDTVAVSIYDNDKFRGSSTTVVHVYYEPFNEYISENIGTLKVIPGGKFKYTMNDKIYDGRVLSYLMSEHEITRGQFEAIMDFDPSDISISSGMNDPVQKITWYTAIAFCNKLSIKEGLTPVYIIEGVDFSTLTYESIPTWDSPSSSWYNPVVNINADGYQLPSGIEWIWAAMGADQDSQPEAIVDGQNVTGYLKHFAGSSGSNNIEDYAWTIENSGEINLLEKDNLNYFDINRLLEENINNNLTHPVGTRHPNELGLYDMSGNVSEYTTDKVGTGNNVTLGGSWRNTDSSCPLYIYSKGAIGTTFNGQGIRLIKKK